MATTTDITDTMAIIYQRLILLKRQVTNHNVIKKVLIHTTHWVTIQAIKLTTTKDKHSKLSSIQPQIKNVPTVLIINTGLNMETPLTIVVGSQTNS